MSAPADPWATDPAEAGRALLNALGDIHREEVWGASFRAIDRLTDREKTCVLIAVMFERARALDAEDRKRGVDERWARRRRLSRACKLAWAAFRLEMGR